MYSVKNERERHPAWDYPLPSHYLRKHAIEDDPRLEAVLGSK